MKKTFFMQQQSIRHAPLFFSNKYWSFIVNRTRAEMSTGPWDERLFLSKKKQDVSLNESLSLMAWNQFLFNTTLAYKLFNFAKRSEKNK